jgi:hypothetical protein
MRPLASRVPLLIAALVIVFANVSFLSRRIAHAQPNTPWEAGLIADGWRVSRGTALYEEPRAGHATAMYGPLLPLTLGAIFKVTGANNYAGRIFEAVCGLLAVTLLAFALTRGQPTFVIFVGWSLLSALNLRTGVYFADTRPDAACLLFSVVAILLMYREDWGSYLAGVAVLLVAFYFKQTAVVVAGVACLAYLIRRGRETLWWLKASVPLLTLPAAVLLTKALHPLAYHYMIEVPAMNPVPPARIVVECIAILSSVACFYIALAEYLSSGEATDKRGAWLLAAIPVTFIYSVVSTARVGGSLNSPLPVLTSFFAFTVWRLPRLLALADSPKLGALRRLAFGATLGSAIVATAFVAYESDAGLTRETQGDEHYERVIEIARDLPGKVVCPNDPTIPLYAKGYAGRQIFMEMDAAGLDVGVPDYALAEISSADYVIQLNKVFLGAQLIPDARLAAMGLRPVEYDELKGTAYTVWEVKR